MVLLPDKIEQALSYIRKYNKNLYDWGIILGTGLGAIADACKSEVKLACNRIPHFPESNVAFHKPNWVMGTLSGKKVVVLQGRFHYYEGHSMQDLTLPVRVMYGLGVKKLIITSMAGSIREDITEGFIAIVKDHINFMGNNPLIGPYDPVLGERFPDMTEPYDREFVDIMSRSKNVKTGLVQAVYLAIQGPSLPTLAEINMYRKFGGDIIGMSVVPEVLVARQLGMRVCALSMISDRSTPVSIARVSQKSIRPVIEKIVPDVKRLVGLILENIE
ncbi:purine-nucleoside phosphorylase [candidate division KSB1 bacterium]|nr:purine-nucleoside phosphorylase [candidate division KSB1 bacterium]